MVIGVIDNHQQPDQLYLKFNIFRCSPNCLMVSSWAITGKAMD